MKKLLFLLLLIPSFSFSQSLDQWDVVREGYYKVVVGQDTLQENFTRYDTALKHAYDTAENSAQGLEIKIIPPSYRFEYSYVDTAVTETVYDTANVEDLTLRQVNMGYDRINGERSLSYQAEAHGDSVLFEYFHNGQPLKKSLQYPKGGIVRDTLKDPPIDSMQVWVHGYWGKWVEPYHEIVDIAFLDTLGEPMAFNNTETQDYVDEVTAQGGITDDDQVDQLITDLKNAGIWSKLDALWLFANESVEAARINLINPTGVSISEIGSVSHHAHAGYLGSGSGALDTGFAPNSGGNYSQNSASFGFFARDIASDGSTAAMGTLNGDVSHRSSLYISSVGEGEYYINDTSSSKLASFQRQGFLHINRDGASSKTLYRNGSSIATSSASSVGLIGLNYYILARNFGGSDSAHSRAQISMAFIGGDLSAEATDFNNAVQTYLDAEFSDLDISPSSEVSYTGYANQQLLVPDTTNAGQDHREPSNLVYDPDDTEGFRWKCFVSRRDSGSGDVVIDMYHGSDLASQMTAYSGNPIIGSYAEDPYVVISDQASGEYWLYCEDNSANTDVGRYSSTDRGRSWSSDGSVGITDAASPTVFTEDGGTTWKMIYEHFDTRTRDTRLATSSDGLSFSNITYNPIVAIGNVTQNLSDLSSDSEIVIDDIIIDGGIYYLFHHTSGTDNMWMMYSNTLADRPDYNEYSEQLSVLGQPYINSSTGDIELLTMSSGDLYHATFDGIVTVEALSGSIDSSLSLSGNVEKQATLSGDITNESAISGNTIQQAALSGNISAESNLSGNLIQQALLSGELQAASELAGAVVKQMALSGQIDSESSLSGQLIKQALLSGSIDAQSALSGNIIIVGEGVTSLSGSISTESSLSGNLTATKQVQGIIESETELSGDVIKQVSLSGNVLTVSSLSADASIQKALAGTLLVSSSISGELTPVGAAWGGTIDITNSPLYSISFEVKPMHKIDIKDDPLYTINIKVKDE